MYPLPAQLPNRFNDFSIEIKGNEARPSKLMAKEKGKIKILNIVGLEKIGAFEVPIVMPIRKRTMDEKEGRSLAGLSKKKGKVYKGEDAKAK